MLPDSIPTHSHIKIPTIFRLLRVIRASPVRDLHHRSLFPNQNRKPRQRRSTVHYLGAPTGILRGAAPRRHCQYLVLYRVHLPLPLMQIWRTLHLRLRRVLIVMEQLELKFNTRLRHLRHPYTARQVRTSATRRRPSLHIPASL